MAHEVVDEWVDRTVALENGEMRGGLISCKTSGRYFWRKSQLRYQILWETKILPESLLPLYYFNQRIMSTFDWLLIPEIQRSIIHSWLFLVNQK